MAGRNVGELEFIVNADTGRLVAQLVKGGNKAGEAGGKATVRAYNSEIDELGGRRLVQALAEVRAKIEASLKNIEAQIGIDDTKARAEAKKLQANLDALEASIDLDLADEEIKADVRFLREQLSQILKDIPVGGKLDVADFKAIAELAEEIISPLVAEVKPQIDQLETAAEAKAAVEEIEAIFAAAQAEIDIKYDEDAWQRRQAKIQADNKKFAEKAGQDWSEGFGDGATSRLTKIAGAIAAVAEPAVAGIEGLLAAATAVIGQAVIAAGAGIAAVGAEAVAFGNVLAGTVTAFAGFGDAIGAVNDEFSDSRDEFRDFNSESLALKIAIKELSPAAQLTVLAFADLRGELAASQSLIQDGFFGGLDKELAVLGKTVLPDITRALTAGAKQAGLFAQDLSRIAQNTDFTATFEALEPALEGSFEAAGNLVETLEPFLKASGPAAQALSDALAGATSYLRDFVSANTSSISTFLENGVRSLLAWADLLGTVGNTLGTIFSAGQSSGDGFVQRLDTIIEKWNGWLQTIEGQNALEDFFGRGESIISSLTPVMVALGEAISMLVTPEAQENFRQLADAIANALPAVANLLAIIGEAGLLTAILNLTALLNPLLSLFLKLPGPLLEFAGAAIVVAAGLIKLVAGLKALGIALSISNPAFIAITVAVAALAVGLSLLGDKTDETAERSQELGRNLDGVVDAMIAEEGAALGATAGIDALNAAMTQGGEDGAKLTEALGNVGKGTEDAASVLSGLTGETDDVVASLADLAISAADSQLGMELTAEAAADLATKVNDTDRNFESSSTQLDRWAKSAGLSTDEALFLARNLEELQDQAEKTSIRDSVEEFFAAERGTAQLNSAIEDLIPTYAELEGATDAVAAQYQTDYINAVDEATEAADAQAEAVENLGETFTSKEQAIAQAIERQQEWKDAVTLAGQEARRAAEDADKLARFTEDAAIAAANAAGFNDGLAGTLVNTGNAFREAASEADSLKSSLDILFGVQLSADEAFDSMLTSVNGLSQGIQDSTEYTDGWTGSINGLNEDSILFREGLRDGITSIHDYATASLEAGVANTEVAATVEAMRANLIAQAVQLGATEAEAGAYIDKLLGTPELLETVIETPGMFDALLNAQDLDLLYDEAGNAVLTEFEQQGIDSALADSEEFKDLLKDIDKQVVKPGVETDATKRAIEETEEFQEAMDEAGDTTVDPEVPMTDVPGAKRAIEDLQLDVDTLADTVVDVEVDVPAFVGVTGKLVDMTADAVELDEVDPKINVSTPGADASIQQLTTLKQKIDALYSKTITITTNQRTTGTPGSMTGRLVTGPMNTDVGERGLAEAIIPLQLPLNRVNPEVRDMAAILRGQGPSPAPVAAGPSRVINNNFTINETDHSETTAHRVANRIASSLN